MAESSKHPRFVSLSREPWNGEPPPELLVGAEVTPASLFYVRNHAPVPAVDAASYRLAVGGLVRRPLRLSLADLRRELPEVEVAATLQCAGNRRRGLMAVRPIPEEEPWGLAAIGNARWRGVRLASVLEAAGLEDGAAHVALLGLDRVAKGGDAFGFGGSVPRGAAVGPRGVVLAWAMNGRPLPPEHGFPLRAVVPGYIGARSVKWLASIEAREEPSENYFQQRAYKLFPPQVGAGDVDWTRGLALGELSVTSAICSPGEDEELPPGPVTVRGYAMAGGARTVERVELSTDGGRVWATADHEPAPPGVWSLWRAELDLPEGEHEIVCRCWDSAANTQPESAAAIWNFKGYMNNAWHRVKVRVGSVSRRNSLRRSR